jgi:polyphosphate kinase
LVERIREVRRAAEDGEEARIRIKVNNLNDEELSEELYRASQAGAKIDIVARSICTLRPGVPGLSEGIRVRSILGRFLEHSRVFIFDAGEKRTILMGSADLMPRNLDHRIELVAPVEDGRAQLDLVRMFDVLLADNASAWELSPEGRWMKLRLKGRSQPACAASCAASAPAPAAEPSSLTLIARLDGCFA